MDRYQRMVQGARRVSLLDVIEVMVYVALIGALILYIILPAIRFYW